MRTHAGGARAAGRSRAPTRADQARDGGVPRAIQAQLETFLERERRRIDAALDRHLPPGEESPEPLHRAMRYGVLEGGKRLRPALAVLACRAAGGRTSQVVGAACAIELVHAFSLIHDDMPCMDDDAVRRGRPTVHRQFGESVALLAGDGLLALAFELVASIREDHGARIQLELARATGSRGMIGGQALEEQLTGRIDEAALARVHRLKTGRLFEAAAAIGGFAAGAEPKILNGLRRYGRALGLGFQIADDLLDDVEARHLSYPGLLGRGGALRALGEALARARRAVRSVEAASRWSNLLIDLTAMVEARGRGSGAVGPAATVSARRTATGQK